MTVLVNEFDAGRRDVLRGIGYEPTGLNVMGAEWVLQDEDRACTVHGDNH